MDKKLISIWRRLALSDLKSARILYHKSHYRTSYLLFQQATEKANKAFGLEYNFITEKDLKEIGHNLLKMYRRHLVNEKGKIDMQLKSSITEKLEAQYKKLVESISVFDKLNNDEQIDMRIKDLNEIYVELKTLNISILKRYPGAVKKMKAAAGANKDVFAFVKYLIETFQEGIFIGLTFAVCAVLTNKHISLTRYPENGKNPLTMYTQRRSIVKMQPVYMNLLEQAIRKFGKRDAKKNKMERLMGIA